MAITKLTAPADPFGATADWTRILAYMTQIWRGAWNGPVSQIDFDNDNVLKGSIFQIGDAIFYADADTAISGTPSNYVQLTPGASTATAAYVASLSGVSWDDTNNGHYDVSGNLYIWNVHQFTTYTSGSGNYTVPLGVTQIKVTAVGGGGGGNDGSAGTSGIFPTGDGGGSGATCYSILKVIPGSTIAYSVGSGGSGEAAGGGGGSSGGNTTFGSITAGGGTLGASTGGDGGSASGGDININGAEGQHVSYIDTGSAYNKPAFSGGQGGASTLGGAGAGVFLDNGGDAVANSGSGGAGGGGGYRTAGAATYAGGNGAAGIIIIEEFGRC